MLRNRLTSRIGDLPRIYRMGRVTRVVGLVIEAAGLDVGLGELCRVTSLSEEKSVRSLCPIKFNSLLRFQKHALEKSCADCYATSRRDASWAT